MDQSHIVTGKPVAVIGAGVWGLVAAKRLASEGFRVDVFERRSQAGGIWNSPSGEFASPVYMDLQTNFPRQLMELQDYPWTTQPLFMRHTLVHGYLEGHSRDIRKAFHGRVRFNFDNEVVSLFHESYAGGPWELTCRSVRTDEETTQRYLFVVMAVGVYDEPFIPHYEGLPAWRQTWTDSVSHSKFYRMPDVFRGPSVLIVGFQASGFDIANKIAASVQRLWIFSTRPLTDVPRNATLMTAVSGFHVHQRTITFTDGQSISGVDHVIFCIGYQYHRPFIKKNSSTDEPLFPSGLSIDRLHEHIIYIEQPNLAFLGIVRGAVPTFLLVQAQAAFVARFFADHVRELRPRIEDSQHRLPYPLFMDYLLRLESLCERADKGRLGSMTQGNNPVFRLTPELDLVRTKRREIREALVSQNNRMTGVWSGTDILHRCHSRFLTVSGENVLTLVPFLILHYGKSIVDSLKDLSGTLGQRETNYVLTRGTQKLFSLARDQSIYWSTSFYRGPIQGVEHNQFVTVASKFIRMYDLIAHNRRCGKADLDGRTSWEWQILEWTWWLDLIAENTKGA